MIAEGEAISAKWQPSAFTVLRSENSTNTGRCEGCRFHIAQITLTLPWGKANITFQSKSPRLVKIILTAKLKKSKIKIQLTKLQSNNYEKKNENYCGMFRN